MVMNWKLQPLSHNLVFLFRLVLLGKFTSIPLLSMHLKSSASSPEPVGFSHLLTLHLSSQMLPSVEYCSHVWGGAPKSNFFLLDKIQSKAIRLFHNPNFNESLQPLSRPRFVGELIIFYIISCYS